MNRIVYYISLGILTGLMSFFMLLSSFSFADHDGTLVQQTEKNTWYRVSLSGTSGTTVLGYAPINQKKDNISSNMTLFWEIGRLSSLMYLSQSGVFSPPVVQSGATGLILADLQWIISLYDLFSTYTIYSTGGEYRIDQITNGSFYIGKEKDGKIAIYAIDGVIRLAFLDKWVEMTNMILFPGSYIRFDPRRNANLKWADLFRTILSLQEWENEVFEFVNPRVNGGDDKDTFFNYRLPLETKILFRAISGRFHDQVEWVDLLKSYASDWIVNTNQSSGWMINPSKRNHLMLLELKTLLSQIVNMKTSSRAIVERVAELYTNAKSLKLESSTAKKTIEQFLLDGRFALYGNISDVGKGYQENYEDIAKMIGITPTTGKSKLLQNLADIYSWNLFLQTSKNSFLKIDTFEPTATTLLSTVQTGGIDQKDYFDIALYAYNILDKVQDKGVLSRDFIENKATYDYLTTFFYAGSKYMNSIEDPEKKLKTISSFSSQFYERMLTILVKSLYNTFMQDDQGALFLKEWLADEKSVKINIDLLRNIHELNGIVSYLNETIKVAYVNDNTSDVYINIEKATLRLEAFSNLLDPEKRNENYKAYILEPYASEVYDGIALPKIQKDLIGIEKYVKVVEEIPVSPVRTLTNKKVDNARALFPDANISVFIPEWDALRVNQALGYIQKKDGSIAEGSWSLVFTDENTVSQIMILYSGRSIEIKSQEPTMSTDILKELMKNGLKPYMDIIDSNSDIAGNVRIFLNNKRIDIGDQQFKLP